MTINGNSESFDFRISTTLSHQSLCFGVSTTLSYLCGANIDKATKQYGSLAFVNVIVFEPINNFRKAMSILLKASSAALNVVTGIYVGTGLRNISEGRNLKESTESVAIALLSSMVGTIALRNLNRYI